MTPVNSPVQKSYGKTKLFKTASEVWFIVFYEIKSALEACVFCNFYLNEHWYNSEHLAHW